MAFQSLLPQYLDRRNTFPVYYDVTGFTAGLFTSSGTLYDHHLYVNSDTDSLHIVGSGTNTGLFTFNHGDMLIQPSSVNLMIVASGNRASEIRVAIFNNRGESFYNDVMDRQSFGGPIPTPTQYLNQTTDFQTYYVPLAFQNRSFNSEELENLHVMCAIQISGGAGSPTPRLEYRIGSIKLLASGDPIVGGGDLQMFVPGHVTHGVCSGDVQVFGATDPINFNGVSNATEPRSWETAPLPSSFYNLNSPGFDNEKVNIWSPITLKLGLTSTSTHPSGSFVDGFFRYNAHELGSIIANESVNNGRYRFYRQHIPPNFTGTFSLSGYFSHVNGENITFACGPGICETTLTSGFVFSSPYAYLTRKHVEADYDPDIDGGFISLNFYSMFNDGVTNRVTDIEFNSLKVEYDGWFIPATGFAGIPLYISGDPVETGDIDLFIEGHENDDHCDLFVQGLDYDSSGIPLYINGIGEANEMTLFIKGVETDSSGIPLYIPGAFEYEIMPLYLHNEAFPASGNVSLFINSHGAGSGTIGGINLYMLAGMGDQMNLYLHNEDEEDNTDNLNLYINGTQVFGDTPGGKSCNLMIQNNAATGWHARTMFLMGSPFIDVSASMPLYIARSSENQSSFTTLYIGNSGESKQSTLYVQGAYISTSGVDLFMPSASTPDTNRVRLYSHGY